MLSLYLQQEDINFTTLPIRVKETTDLLHQLIEKYNRNQLDDTEYAKVNGMFLEVDDRTTQENASVCQQNNPRVIS